MILFLLDNHCLCCDFIHSFLISVLNSVWVWPLSLCTELLGGENSTACFSFCRGIFKLLVKFQLENKDNPSYAGAHSHSAFMSPFSSAVCNHSLSSVQDCHSRISTSDVERHSWWTLTSRWGLSWQSSETTNWYGHARWTSTLQFPNSHSLSVCSTWGLSHLFALLQGADGVEYLIVAVDASTLMDFLENEEGDWVDETSDLWIISSRRCAAAHSYIGIRCEPQGSEQFKL